jgi:UDP-N-acetylmuramoyl-tripeptide--D-alanyl-D-alanine ligase
MAVIEMGANHPGEIAELCRIADPEAGIITNIGKAHLEGFGSEEGVFNTKKALFDHVIDKHGSIFLHEKETRLREYAKYENAVIYGAEHGGITGKIINSDPTITAEIRINDALVTVKTNLFGEYNLFNVLAAATIGNHYHVNTALIVNAIEAYNPTNNRSQIAVTPANTLIMDAYNANPSSMSNAIRSFAVSTAEKKAVILGDMLELGIESEKEHLNILQLLEQLNFDETILVGNEFCKFNQSEKNIAFADVAACREKIAKEPMEGFTILIKGSRGIQLEKLKDIL